MLLFFTDLFSEVRVDTQALSQTLTKDVQTLLYTNSSYIILLLYLEW